MKINPSSQQIFGQIKAQKTILYGTILLITIGLGFHAVDTYNGKAGMEYPSIDIIQQAHAQSVPPLIFQNVIVEVSDCFITYDSGRTATSVLITNNNFLTLRSITLEIIGFDEQDRKRDRPYSLSISPNLQPEFTDLFVTQLSYERVEYPKCEARISAINFVDAPQYTNPIRDSLTVKLDEFEDRITNVETHIVSINDVLTMLQNMIDNIMMPGPEPVITTGISGKVYTDSNNNGILDSRELGISGRTVIAVNLVDLSDTSRAITETNGDYSFDLVAGGYLIQVEGTDTYAYVTVPDGIILTQNLGL